MINKDRTLFCQGVYNITVVNNFFTDIDVYKRQAAIAVLAVGVDKGIGRANMIFMPVLVIIFIIVVIQAVFLPVLQLVWMPCLHRTGKH